MNFQIELTENEINYILSALQDKPFKEVVALIDKIMKQANEQLAGSSGQTNEVPAP